MSVISLAVAYPSLKETLSLILSDKTDFHSEFYYWFFHYFVIEPSSSIKTVDCLSPVTLNKDPADRLSPVTLKKGPITKCYHPVPNGLKYFHEVSTFPLPQFYWSRAWDQLSVVVSFLYLINFTFNSNQTLDQIQNQFYIISAYHIKMSSCMENLNFHQI